MEYPRISIVTPSYNQAKYLSETIESILSQNYPNLEYIIVDGGSTDGSVEIIKQYSSKLSYWVSEPDKGLYHALQKGFAQATGEVMGWLNSDDMLHKGSLFVLANIFTDLPQVNWLQGRPTEYDETGMVTNSTDPISSRYHFYLKRYVNGSFIQQESTYWRRSLWDGCGAYISDEYKYAGDFELWMRFFSKDQLYCTQALIGGYRVRKSQLSRTFFNEYIDECTHIIDKQVLTAQQVDRLKSIKFFEKYILKIRIIKLIFINRYNALFDNGNLIKFNFNANKFYME